MAKKKLKAPKKFSFFSMVAFIGAAIAFVAFFIPLMTTDGSAINGIDLTNILFGVKDIGLEAGAMWTLMQINQEAAKGLEAMMFVTVLVAGAYMLYSFAGMFCKPCRGNFVNLIFAGLLIACGVIVLACGGAIQADTTVEIAGKTMVGITMNAGAYLIPIGGIVGVICSLFIRKR